MTKGEQDLAVFCAIRSIDALHSKGYAWMDVKPANFVFCALSRSYVAIDLEGVCGKDQIVTASAQVNMIPKYFLYPWYILSIQYSFQVTMKYACPLFARGQPVTAEAFDLWSLGMLIMEVYGGGRTLLSGLDCGEAIRARLSFITQSDIDSYIQNHFKMNRGVRKTLEALLKVGSDRCVLLQRVTHPFLCCCCRCPSIRTAPRSGSSQPF